MQVSADASASWSKLGNELALRQMENAGAAITTVDQITSEPAIDSTTGGRLSNTKTGAADEERVRGVLAPGSSDHGPLMRFSHLRPRAVRYIHSGRHFCWHARKETISA